MKPLNMEQTNQPLKKGLTNPNHTGFKVITNPRPLFPCSFILYPKTSLVINNDFNLFKFNLVYTPMSLGLMVKWSFTELA